jgi:hypothetical protein
LPNKIGDEIWTILLKYGLVFIRIKSATNIENSILGVKETTDGGTSIIF